MKLLICGMMGHMGRQVMLLARTQGMEIVGVDPAAPQGNLTCRRSFAEDPGPVDAVVDFSHHSAAPELLAYARRQQRPVVIGTTGHTPQEQTLIREAAGEIPVFLAANCSLGMVLLTELAVQAARVFPQAEIEIVEKHHRRKQDAPSGTALALGRALQNVRPGSFLRLGRSGEGRRDPREIGIHSLRMGELTGVHQVLLATPTQTLTLTHEACSPALYAEGALSAAAFLQGKAPGLYGPAELFSALRREGEA